MLVEINAQVPCVEPIGNHKGEHWQMNRNSRSEHGRAMLLPQQTHTVDKKTSSFFGFLSLKLLCCQC